MKVKYLKNIPVFDKFTHGLFIESETLGDLEILKFIYNQISYVVYPEMNVSWLDELAKYMKVNEGILFEPKNIGKEVELKRFYDLIKLMNVDLK